MLINIHDRKKEWPAIGKALHEISRPL